MEANELDTLRNRLQEREDELRNLRLSLDVLTPVDLATGLLNRNGLLEAIENAARWMERRREQFGVVAIMVPGIQDLADDTARANAIRHLGASLAAAVRAVDDVGRLNDSTFALVLRELSRPGVDAVAERLKRVVSVAMDGEPAPSTCQIGAVLIVNDARQPSTLLGEAYDAAFTATSGSPHTVVL